MAKRTLCLMDGKNIGIETIFTVIDGKQINIPEKLKLLRAKSQKNELFCPCGCGANLVLVAGDKNLREQHFRLKDGTFTKDCHVILEGNKSVNSKIVLKCWLDDKLKATDLETRVPIHELEDTNRKYEFSFLSKEKKVAVSYCRERINLLNEKMELLGNNSKGINIVYIVDIENAGNEGQYPEALMKVQQRQGYCLFLTIENSEYTKSLLTAAFYVQDIDGLWQEIEIVNGFLKDFSIGNNGEVFFRNETLKSLLIRESKNYACELQYEKNRRMQEEMREAEERKKIFEQEERWEKERQHLQNQAIQMQQTEMLDKKIGCSKIQEEDFSQQTIQIRDEEGNRYAKCEFCKKIAKESEFVQIGGLGRINLGICKECSKNNPKAKFNINDMLKDKKPKSDLTCCPKCGGALKEIIGYKGKFLGCSKYPSCDYTRNMR